MTNFNSNYDNDATTAAYLSKTSLPSKVKHTLSVLEFFEEEQTYDDDYYM